MSISEGTREQSSTIAFTENDGGTNGYYINYMAYGSEKPVISGGKRITGWTQVSGQNYYVADVPLSEGYTDYFRQLYVNGVRIYRASGPWVKGITYYDSPYATDTTIDGINFLPQSVKIYSNPTDVRLLHVNSFKIDE
ncbi:hypothetical protein ACHHV8_01640 [Paenibacillus sp. TAB 01]|uniref:hypothetical protein n=1 Tax=Paenibacillus sp. TAB 01 TaxID=3368988 RepID=UPI0037512FEE